MSTKVTLTVDTKVHGHTGVYFVSNKPGKDKKTKDLVAKGVPSSVLEKIRKHFGEDFKAELGQHLFFRDAQVEGFENVIVIGLGDSSRMDAESVRRAAGHGSRDLHLKSKVVNVSYENVSSLLRDKFEAVYAFAEGTVMGAYRFDELKLAYQKNAKEEKTTTVVLVCKNKTEASAAQKAVEKGVIVGQAVNFARRLGDLPGNIATPTYLGEQAAEAAKGTKLKVTVWDRARIEKERMGNFVGVAKGSDEPCKFIIMEYKGGSAKQKPYVFVGKGLTFDSGGISIKPGASMEEMKYDMCGGANVIATVAAIARLKLKINVIGLVPATENMPNGRANKPGDITVARNGKSTEVNNTDAEGRLILSDALVYASEQDPAFIVDAATLTGAMSIALGDTHTGYFTTNEKMRKVVEQAAKASGEKIWQMPLSPEHLQDMKGNYADLSNISYNKGAGSAKGAAYLSEFVEEGIPWAHFDIAGTAWNTGNRIQYNPKKGASGCMIRTFIQLAEDWK